MWLEKLQDIWWKIRWSSRATGWLHVLAMYAPFNSWRLFFYRLRGIRIGRRVYIVQGCFLEESRPWLITIEDDVKIGAGTIIATHDGIYHKMDSTIPYRYGEVVLRKRSIVAPGCVILPGVTVGEGALVAPGAVVVKDVPAGTVVSTKAASHLMTIEEGLARVRPKVDELRALDRATKYPWRMRRRSSHDEESAP